MKNISIYDTTNRVRKEHQELEAPKHLTWYVFNSDWNNSTIECINLFDYKWPFLRDLYYNYLKNKEDFDLFAKDTLSLIMYYFWSKSEDEIVLTSWPTSLGEEEIQRLVKELKNEKEKYPTAYRYSVFPKLPVAEKIDVATQIIINWDQFIKYLWDNKELIKEYKKYNK